MLPWGAFRPSPSPPPLPRFPQDARAGVVAKMKELGFLDKIDPHKNRVGTSYRSKAIIEPYVSKQWFVKMDGFKQPLIDAVKEGKVNLVPANWDSTYYNWIENLRDWCISRQLWWGHRIPIWYGRGGACGRQSSGRGGGCGPGVVRYEGQAEALFGS